MKAVTLIIISFLLLVDCSQPCACGPEPRAYYYFFYKSSSNPDLLQPQSGIYNPADVKLYEVINNNGTITQNPAPAVNGQYVFDNGTRQGVYFIYYQSSIFQYQKDLKKTLIQLKQGVTDTLTYTFVPSSSYPQQIFYNSKPVWKLGDGMEILIVK
ncbi:MAG: hypothetical protein HY015_10975 [Bacteroidetes bacterium]|nr:hypothetical protein [Bacteroidota bacterium]MBI3483473.1 hypothetical protein [Bacteroidota bacterium]